MSLLPAILFVAFAVLNIATFIAFAIDKQAAIKRRSRIPERTLLLAALLGGSPGALIGQRVLRHKTRKEPFRTFLLFIAVLQAILLVLLLVPAFRDGLAAMWSRLI